MSCSILYSHVAGFPLTFLICPFGTACLSYPLLPLYISANTSFSRIAKTRHRSLEVHKAISIGALQIPKAALIASLKAINRVRH